MITVIYTIIFLLMFNCETLCLPKSIQDSTLAQKSSSLAESSDDSDVIHDVIKALDDASTTSTKYKRVDDAIMLLLTGQVKDATKQQNTDDKLKDIFSEQNDRRYYSENSGEKEILESFFAATRGRLIPQHTDVNVPEGVNQPATELLLDEVTDAIKHTVDTDFSQRKAGDDIVSPEVTTSSELRTTPTEYQSLELRHNRNKQIITSVCQSLGQEDCDRLINLLRKISDVPLREMILGEATDGNKDVEQDHIRSKDVFTWNSLADRSDHDRKEEYTTKIERKDESDAIVTKNKAHGEKSRKNSLVLEGKNTNDLADKLYSALARFASVMNNQEEIDRNDKIRRETNSEKQNPRQKRSIVNVMPGQDGNNVINENDLIYVQKKSTKENSFTNDMDMSENPLQTNSKRENLHQNLHRDGNEKNGRVSYAQQVDGRFDKSGIQRNERKRIRRNVGAHQNNVRQLHRPGNMTPELRKTLEAYMAWKQQHGQGMANARWG